MYVVLCGRVYNFLVVSHTHMSELSHVHYVPHIQCSVEVVELDGEILTVAEKWFGFRRGESMSVHIADGVSFVNECISANKHSEKFFILK